jgi:peptide/nickel transport system permease protein
MKVQLSKVGQLVGTIKRVHVVLGHWGFAALLVLIIVLVATLLAPWIAPYDPGIALADPNEPPGTGGLWLGSDGDGRDIFSRLIWGGRVTLSVAFIPTLSAGLTAAFFGSLVGFFGGWVDSAVSRLLDILFAFPMALVALVVAGVLSRGIVGVMIALFVSQLPYVMRVARSIAVDVAHKQYVEAAGALGAGRIHLLGVYVLPNVLPRFVTYTLTLLSVTIVLGSGLSFLGIGVVPPQADWGVMVADGRTVLYTAPYVALLPGLAIVLVSVSLSILADVLRDRVDVANR